MQTRSYIKEHQMRKNYHLFYLILVTTLISARGGGGDSDEDKSPDDFSRKKTLTLSWDIPTQYVDGSVLPASELVTYRIYSGLDLMMILLGRSSSVILI